MGYNPTEGHGLELRLLVEPELKQEGSDIGKLAEEIRLLREKVDQMQGGDREQPPDPRP